MSDHTNIEWTDATWNPITGCSVVSPGCTHCYAQQLAGTRLQHHPSRAGLTRKTKAGPVWTGEVRLNADWLTQPLSWRRPRRIFVCAHGDLFAEGVPDEWIDKVFAVMALAPRHIFQVLTKRPERMRAYLAGYSCDGARRFHIADAAGRLMEDGDGAADTVANAEWPLPNVWLGTSVEDQRRADERIPLLLDTPAAIRWISAEPLLGPLDVYGGDPDPRLGGVVAGEGLSLSQWWRHDDPKNAPPRPGLDWVVAGGESGPGARPMHPDWARSLRDQCAAAGVPFFFKQWGAWAPGEAITRSASRTERAAWWSSDRWSERNVPLGESEEMHIDDEPDVWHVGKAAAGRILDGRTHDEMPDAPR